MTARKGYDLESVLRCAWGILHRRGAESGDPVVMHDPPEWPAGLDLPPAWAAWEDGTLWRFASAPARIEFGARVRGGPLGWLVFSRDAGEWVQIPPGSFRRGLWGVSVELAPVGWEPALVDVADGDLRTGRERFVLGADMSREHVARVASSACEICGEIVLAGAVYVERVDRQGGDNRRAHQHCVEDARAARAQQQGVTA